MNQGHAAFTNKTLVISSCCGLLALLWMITHLLPDWFGYGIADMLWGSSITLFVIVGTTRLKVSRTMKNLVLLSYVVRLVLALIGVYGTSAVAVSLRSVDDIYGAALRFFEGDFSFWYTNYTPFLYVLFQFTGPDRIAPTLLNILFWYLGYFIMQAAAVDFYGKEKSYFVLFYSFLPNELLFSIKVAREAIIWLSLMLSFYFVLKWMRDGKFVHVILSVIAAAPAVLMHRGCTAMWFSILLIVVFWQQGEQGWRVMNVKTFLLLVVLLIGGMIGGTMVVSLYNKVYRSYFPATSIQDIFRSFTESMTWGQTVAPGRSDYLTFDVTYRDPIQLLGNTLYLMLYFWISPTPRFWNSLSDIIGFLFDMIPWLIFFFLYARQLRKKCVDRRAFAGVIILLAFTVIFAWGSKNAGTSMRHRGKLLGVLTMAAMVATKRPASQAEDTELLTEPCRARRVEEG